MVVLIINLMEGKKLGPRSLQMKQFLLSYMTRQEGGSVDKEQEIHISPTAPLTQTPMPPFFS
jgi:hypothetical protein